MKRKYIKLYQNSHAILCDEEIITEINPKTGKEKLILKIRKPVREE